jgi:hypothetical protein
MNGARFVHDTLEEHGWEVLVADAQRVKGLAPLACKTDKIDARVLAELCRRDLVPALWVPSLTDRELRERLRRRMHLVRMRASAMNRIFGRSPNGACGCRCGACANRTPWRCCIGVACRRSGEARSPKRWP